MKRVLLLSFFIVLLSSLVMAGESFDIDFDEGDAQGVVMGGGDEVRFEMFDAIHSIYIDDISVSSGAVKFHIAPFLENDTRAWPGYTNLDVISNIDLQKDGITDLYVALYSIEDDGRAILVFQKANQEENLVTSDVGLVEDDGSFNKTLYLIIIGAAIVGLLVFLVFRSVSSSKSSETLDLEEKDDIDEIGEDLEEEKGSNVS